VTSMLPQDWRDADIVPVFKSGDKTACGNYRPISLTSIVIKIFERLVSKRLVQYVETSLLLDEEQFGFRRGKSCEMQLLLYTHFVAKQLDLKRSVHAVYLDLQKAFDKVPHTQLMWKLQYHFGITGAVLQWLCAFLSGRRQRVKVGSEYSCWADVKSGVPQGSVLAPFLFILYVHDMQKSLRGVQLLKFADDTKLFTVIRDNNDCGILQTNIDELHDWCKRWQMPVNVNKTAVVEFGLASKINHLYTLDGGELRVSPNERDLGIIVSSSLSFKQHIQSTVTKALKMYGWMMRNLASRDPDTVMKVYKCLIRPTIEYGCAVWSPSRSGLVSQVEKVQRKVTKAVVKQRVPYEDRLRTLKLPSLRWRRNYLDILKVHQIVHGDDDLRKQLFTFSSEISQSALRRHRLSLYKKAVHCDVYKHHFANRVIDQWNSLPHELLQIYSFDLFKRKLKAYLMAKNDVYK
jgi:hypothetical protein